MGSGSDKRQRGTTISIRASKDEKARLAELASKAGLAKGAFVRAALFGDPGPRSQTRRPASDRTLRQMLGHLGKVNSNVSQITEYLTPGEQVAVPELAAARAAYDELRAALHTILTTAPQNFHRRRASDRELSQTIIADLGSAGTVLNAMARRYHTGTRANIPDLKLALDGFLKCRDPILAYLGAVAPRVPEPAP